MTIFNRLRPYLLSAGIIIAALVGYWFYSAGPRPNIVSYDPYRDRPFIESLFHRDWYWLTAQPYDPALFEQWLGHKSPTADATSFGILDIRVAQINNSDVGFVAYYMKSAQEGIILFIDVQPTHRSKRIGNALLEFAVADLQRRGATVVRLITRPHNVSARRLYERSGFGKYAETPDYVFYQRKLF